MAVDEQDVFQDTMTRLLRYPPDVSKSRDPKETFLMAVYTNARCVLMDLQGYHNGGRGKRSYKAEGQLNTKPAGLFQTVDRYRPDRHTGLMDERILPPVASAEDVYMASVPSRRQQALWDAIETLPERQRVAMTHQYYDELSVAESAERMGVTVQEVYAARGEGMRSLKRKLNPKGKNG